MSHRFARHNRDTSHREASRDDRPAIFVGGRTMLLRRRLFRKTAACRLAAMCLAVFFLGAISGCSHKEEDKRPNILWIVWDTARADRMSLYGHERPTTPNVDAWAAGARVFDDCMSAASTTVPSHASMFTGLMPSEHGVSNSEGALSDEYDTIAELLQRSGYRTYVFSANPHVSRASKNLTQGFEVEEHPWDAQYGPRARRIVAAKAKEGGPGSEVARLLRSSTTSPWIIKACGELAAGGVTKWLDSSESDKPFFVFVNYMEAHRPLLPARSFRQKVMTPSQIDPSYRVDISWPATWEYVFKLGEYTWFEQELIGLTYDAAICELDAMFGDLMASLKAGGHLDNTLVILTADHGELLGEHHMLDHQFSVHEPLVHVPLIIHYPAAFKPGRDDSPVMNFDLFPTLLSIANLDAPQAHSALAVDLLRPDPERQRIAEYLVPARHMFKSVKESFPTWDPTPFDRSLRAIRRGDQKFIWGSDGRHELYDLEVDPKESRNFIRREKVLADSLQGDLDKRLKDLREPRATDAATFAGEEARRQQGALGYVDIDEDEDRGAKDEPATTRPGS